MTRRLLLLTLLLLLFATAVISLWPADDVDPHREARRSRAAGEVATAAAAVDATAPPAGNDSAARVEAAAQKNDAPAIPADAKWVEILVVVGATGRPVADADVAWIDSSIYEHVDLPDAQKQWLYRDQERMARRYGWRTHTDTKGIARVHQSDWTMVFGRQGDLYGALQCSRDTPPPPGGYRLELVPDLSLSVQVLDANDKPAPGVQVAVAQHGADGKFLQYWQWGALANSDADGMARLVHLQEWHQVDQGMGATVAHWRVRPFLPGCSDPGVEFDPKAPPSTPVVLHLPPCGSVAARAELRGQPIGGGEGRGGVNLQAGGGEDGPAWWMEPGPDGYAHFPYVPVGHDYLATANVDSTQVQQPFAGPRMAGERITVVLALGDEQIIIAGRVLDPQRQLVRNASLSVQCEADDFYGGGMMRTDAMGRFQFCLGATKTRITAHRVVAEWNREHEVPLRGCIGERELVPGLQDIGDLLLAPGPMLVSGRFLRGEQPYTRQTQLLVERFAADADPPAWTQPDGLMTHQGADGTFEVRGEAPAGRLRLVFPAWEHLPIAPIEFAPGATDIVVQVQEGSGLLATLLLPKDMPWGPVLALVPEPGTEVPEVEGNHDRNPLETQAWSRDGVRYEAQWRALSPGSYRLEYRLFAVKEPLLRLEHVLVPTPEGGDPRLCDIDLRDKIEILTLRLCDRSGAPLSEGTNGIAVPLPQATSPAQCLEVPSIGARFAFPPGPVDLLLAMRGFRPQQLRGLRGDVKVTLEPWPQLTLEFVDLPPLPEGCHLTVQLQEPAAGELRQYQGQWSSGSEDDYLLAPIEQHQVENGRVTMLAGDGMQRLQVRLVHDGEGRGEGSETGLTGVTPTECYAGPAPVQVRVTAAVLQQAIAALRLAK